MPFRERRKHPRAPEVVSCQLRAGSSSFTAETRNVSCGGALCYLAEPIPVMMQLEILLHVPAPFSQGPPVPIHCAGVVVRQTPCTDVGKTGYLTAIFFSRLKAEDRKRIAEFVLQSMLAHDRRRS